MNSFLSSKIHKLFLLLFVIATTLSLALVPEEMIAGDLGLKNTELANKATQIFQNHCTECHEGAEAEAGLRLLDFKQIFSGKADSGEALVDLNHPENSLIYKQVLTTSSKVAPMPKGKRTKLSANETQVILNWIRTEQTKNDPTADIERPILSDRKVEDLIFDDLRNLSPAQAKGRRYLTLNNLINRTHPSISDSDLELYRQGVSKLINSLSWVSHSTVPFSVDAGRIVLRIDLSDYGWSTNTWDKLVQSYPYSISFDQVSSQAIRQETGTEIPYVRADWFCARASRAPLYDELLELPSTDLELENRLGINVARDIKEATVARAGFPGGAFEGGSRVSDNNRLIERHETHYGMYWKSYDFSSSEGEQNLMDRPLGPAPESTDFVFKHAGGEIIFNLPNSLQGYMIVRGTNRITQAPSEIVRDKLNQNRAVVNGLSCIGCHSEGVNRTYDQILDRIGASPTLFSAITPIVKSLYRNKDELDALFDLDENRFHAALKAAGVKVVQEPVSKLALDFEAPVTRAKAAAELGLSIEDFDSGLAKKAQLEVVKGLLDGAGMTRDKFISFFQSTVQLMELGSVRSFASAASREIDTTNVAGTTLLPVTEQKFDLIYWEVIGTEAKEYRYDNYTERSYDRNFMSEVTGQPSESEGLNAIKKEQVVGLMNALAQQFNSEFSYHVTDRFFLTKAYTKEELKHLPKTQIMPQDPSLWPSDHFEYNLDDNPTVREHFHQDGTSYFHLMAVPKNVTFHYFLPFVKQENGQPINGTPITIFASELPLWSERAKNMGYIIGFGSGDAYPNTIPIEADTKLPFCRFGEWKGDFKIDQSTGKITLVH